MFKSKVSCWFCSEESYVYFYKKNSWTCESCGQYNGFNKDGDYNKQIPEMQVTTNKKFCTTSNGSASVNSSNFLCEKCNNFQELKMIELKNFESKSDEKSEEEYNLYKKKLDQIYDLCTACKQKLNMHLRKQDQQIGNYVLKKRKTQQLPSTDNLKPVINSKSNHHSNGNGVLPKNDLINDKNNDLNNSKNSTNDSIYNFSKNFSTTIKKAYTIAGTVPALVIGKSPSKETFMNGNGKHHHSQKQQSPKLTNDSSLSNNKSNVKITDKITSGSLGIIFEDMIVLLLNILILICDFVNLINDSDLFNDNEQNFFKSDDLTWFQFFLTIYKYISTILLVNFILSLHGIYKRPKISRILTLIGFICSAVVHLHLLGQKLEEQYIFEVFISFFLVSYLVTARIYNVFQLIKYFGII